MARAILELNSFFDERLCQIRLPDFGCSTGSIGLIEGGSGINIVPAECAIQVDVRLLPGQDAGQTHREIETYLRDRMKSVKDIEWSYDPPSLIDPAYEVSDDSELVRQACAVLGQPKSEVVFYACDGSKIAAKNVPCIVLGPGDIAVAHTADEAIAVEELAAGTEAYVRLAQTLMPPARV
jgi:acetylornithine deacetylase